MPLTHNALGATKSVPSKISDIFHDLDDLDFMRVHKSDYQSMMGSSSSNALSQSKSADYSGVGKT